MTYHRALGLLPISSSNPATVARVVAENRYRAHPNAATFAAYRLAIYRELPTGSNYVHYQRARTNLRVQEEAADKIAMVATRRRLGGRTSGPGDVLEYHRALGMPNFVPEPAYVQSLDP